MKRFKKLHCPKKMLFSANINAKTVKNLRNKEISRTFEKILKSKILKLCKHFSYNKQTYIYIGVVINGVLERCQCICLLILMY